MKFRLLSIIIVIIAISNCLANQGAGLPPLYQCEDSDPHPTFEGADPKLSPTKAIQSGQDYVVGSKNFGRLSGYNGGFIVIADFPRNLAEEKQYTQAGMTLITHAQLTPITGTPFLPELLFGSTMLNLQLDHLYFTKTVAPTVPTVPTENRYFALEKRPPESYHIVEKEMKGNYKGIYMVEPPLFLSDFEQDVDAAQEQKIQILNPNIVKYFIKAGDQTFLSNTFDYIYTPKAKESKDTLSIQLQFFNGIKKSYCLNFWTRKQRKSLEVLKNTTLDVDQIKTVKLVNIGARNLNDFLIDSGVVPIIPTTNQSSFYVLYPNKDQTELQLQLVNKDGQNIGVVIKLDQPGYPLDVLEVSTRIFTLLELNKQKKIVVCSFDKLEQFKQVWKKEITLTDEEIINGKLSFFRGELFVTYTLKSSSPLNKWRSTFVKYKIESGDKIQPPYVIEKSSILHFGSFLPVLFRGNDRFTKFFSCYFDQTQSCPQGILSLDPETQFKHEQYSSTLGDLVRFDDNLDETYFIFKQKKVGPNTEFEIKFMKFDKNLEKVSDKFIIITDTEAKDISNLKAVAFGNNILLSFSKKITTSDNNDAQDQQQLALYDRQGEKLSGPSNIDFKINPYGNLQTLFDGSIVFSDIKHSTGDVSLRLLPIGAASSSASATENPNSNTALIVILSIVGVLVICLVGYFIFSWLNKKK